MPEKQTIERARKAKRQGKAPSTQAGEFVREEVHHVRRGKHGARSPEQVIAIGLSKARKAGVKVPAKKGGRKTSARGRTTAGKRTGRSSSRGTSGRRTTRRSSRGRSRS